MLDPKILFEFCFSVFLGCPGIEPGTSRMKVGSFFEDDPQVLNLFPNRACNFHCTRLSLCHIGRKIEGVGKK